VIWGAVAGGLAGTVVLTTILRSASEFGLTRMDIPFLLGTALTTDRVRAKAIGYALHFVFGLLFALAYYAIFLVIGHSGFVLGAGFGLMLVAAGLAAVRYGWLPRWAAWVTLVLGVLTASPVIWPAMLVVPFWIAGLGIAVFRMEAAAVEAPRAAPAPAPPDAQPAL
jgi:hypothetical protein